MYFAALQILKYANDEGGFDLDKKHIIAKEN